MADAQVGLTSAQGVRVVAAVKKIEGLAEINPAFATKYNVGITQLAKGVLTQQVVYKGKSTACTPGQMQVWMTSDPNDSTTIESSNGDYSTITVYAWALPNPTTIPVNSEVIAGYMNGRWYVIEWYGSSSSSSGSSKSSSSSYSSSSQSSSSQSSSSQSSSSQSSSSQSSSSQSSSSQSSSSQSSSSQSSSSVSSQSSSSASSNHRPASRRLLQWCQANHPGRNRRCAAKAQVLSR